MIMILNKIRLFLGMSILLSLLTGCYQGDLQLVKPLPVALPETPEAPETPETPFPPLPPKAPIKRMQREIFHYNQPSGDMIFAFVFDSYGNISKNFLENHYHSCLEFFQDVLNWARINTISRVGFWFTDNSYSLSTQSIWANPASDFDKRQLFTEFRSFVDSFPNFIWNHGHFTPSPLLIFSNITTSIFKTGVSLSERPTWINYFFVGNDLERAQKNKPHPHHDAITQFQELGKTYGLPTFRSRIQFLTGTPIEHDVYRSLQSLLIKTEDRLYNSLWNRGTDLISRRRTLSELWLDPSTLLLPHRVILKHVPKIEKIQLTLVDATGTETSLTRGIDYTWVKEINEITFPRDKHGPLRVPTLGRPLNEGEKIEIDYEY